MKNIRILIADDHAFVRMGIAGYLETETDMEVVGEAQDGKEAVRLADRLSPDVIIMDLMMPKLDGASATKEILRAHPETKIIILSAYGTANGIAHAIESGAAGVVAKTTNGKQLITAIRKVVSGGTAIPPEMRRQIETEPPIPEFTKRQSEVLQSMTRGLTNQDIARQLGLSEDRVEEHVTAILAKIGAANRTEAVAIALRKHLLKI